MIVVIAEKPSVARELAAVLCATSRREGFLEGSGYRVTWAIGHLVTLASPEEIDPRWRTWSRETLPMLPVEFPLRVIESSQAQYRVVERLLCDRATTSVVAATDAGREGELIFRYIYRHAGCTKPWQRLWLSSMTPAAIRKALDELVPGTRYDGLAAAAYARSAADWLVGMNLSRAYTLTHGSLCSVGRVQTPTLAMIVDRDSQIRAFVPTPYLEIEATFSCSKGTYKGTYYGQSTAALRDADGRLAFKPALARLADSTVAEAIAARARRGAARVAAVERSLRRTQPPQLYDLTELQRHSNQLFGYTAEQTLKAAQSLYEQHKMLSYPRTDSRHLTTAVVETLPDIVRAIAPIYSTLVAEGSGARELSRRYVDDAKVGDHHALLPTNRSGALPDGSPEARIYDLVCRRLLMCWHSELVEGVTRVLTEVAADADSPDFYGTSGVSLEAPGWTVLEVSRRSPRDAAPIPGGLERGDSQHVDEVTVLRKQTQPPKPFTEATLLTAMEHAGRQLEDKALHEALKESGLGTPATRAATIETLIARTYVVREGKSLRATPTGIALISAVHPLVKSAELTGRWELRLRRMERSEEALEPFMRDIAGYVQEVVAAEHAKPAASPCQPERHRSQPARTTQAPRQRQKGGRAPVKRSG